MTPALLTIRSAGGDYPVEEFASIDDALRSVMTGSRVFYLVDRHFAELHHDTAVSTLPPERTLFVEAAEATKTLEALSPLVCRLLECGIRRDSVLVVIGGGTIQDVGCFIASTLLRGIAWELVPTTLLAQADSCIGSKSSINVGHYKNQLGTFYPPHRVLLVPGVLRTLPWDEVRSGIGEVIKLQLLEGEEAFRELMADLAALPGSASCLSKWVRRSLTVKQRFIEADERDTGIRNLLNYGHTFGHAFESATHYAIPHGIAVILGMLAATRVSLELGLVSRSHYEELGELLEPWHRPHGSKLTQVGLDEICRAIRMDKKNTNRTVNCILTRGFGRMEKRALDLRAELAPTISGFIVELS